MPALSQMLQGLISGQKFQNNVSVFAVIPCNDKSTGLYLMESMGTSPPQYLAPLKF